MVSVPSRAQEQNEDRGFLEGSLEDAISGPGRYVDIIGFEGALSSVASIEELTIADDDGIWLTLRGVELDWARSALLRGRLEVENLSADEIELPRLPRAPDDAPAPSPEATPFALPDLPVSVNVANISSPKIVIGAPVLGQDATLTLEGAMTLEGGAGTARLLAERTDGKRGRFDLSVGYANESQVLSINIDLDEGAGGIVASLAGIPGEPALALGVAGDAPLSDFAADIRLATDGVDRLTGRVTVGQARADDAGTTPEDRVFSATLSGDVRPLFEAQYRPFFGAGTELDVSGTQSADGAVTLDTLRLEAEAVTLEGSLALAPGGLPQKIDVTGRIANADGSPVLLPLSGPQTRIGSVDLAVQFDADDGEAWTAGFVIDTLDRPDFKAEVMRLNGGGRIGRLPEDQRAFVTAAFDFSARNLDLGSEAAEAALGETVTGRAQIAWEDGAPLNIEALSVTGESYSAEIAGALSTEGDLNFDGRVAADVADLRAFSGLAGRPISGAVEASVEGNVALLSGQFDLTAQSATRDVTVGIREIDALLEGNGQLTVLAARNTQGLDVKALRVATPVALVSGKGILSSDGSRGEIEARLQDAAILLEGLEGPVSLTAAASQDGPVWTIDVASTGDALGLDVEGAIDTGPDVPVFEGEIAAAIADLAPFSRFAGRELGGALDADISGRLSFDATQVDAEIALGGQDLAVGIPQADRVLAGTLEASAAVRRDGDAVDVSALRFETPAARITGKGAWRDGASRADIVAELRDASLALEGLEGELRLTAKAQQTGDIWDVSAQSTGDAIGLDLDGKIDMAGEVPVFDGDVAAELAELEPFSQLAGRALGGRLSADASGVVAFDLSQLDLVLGARGESLSVGQLEADKILAGASELSAAVARDGTAITVREARFQSPALTASGTATLGQAENRVALEARLSDLAAFVPDVAGPASVNGTAVQTDGGDWQIDLDIDGPGGTTVAAAGAVAPAFDNADLTLRGRAPLQLANPFIAPRQVSGALSFDLALNGAPGLPALSGQLQTSGARLVAPELGIVLNDLRATVGLGGAQANLDIAAAVQSGGRITVTGPLGLTAPNASDLRINLRRVVLTDPSLYESSVDGTLTIAGPLAGGARIGGRLALGPSELRIPSATVGGTGAIPDIRHVNEPRDVRLTRSRAGLIDDGKSSGGPGSGGPVFPLDLVITAENQIFIRGRGLDAEMAGQLRLSGTTADIVPIGQFNLVRGRLDILGKRLVLNDGLVQLQGNFDPFIRLEATTQTEDVTVRIVVEGLASDPQIRFLSEPQLPEEEVVAQLLFGRGIETLSPLQAAQLASAVATLAGRGGNGVLSKVRESTGLDDLDVTTGDDGATAVRAGKYISEKVYTDVTVASDGESEVNLNFDLSPRVTLKGSVDTTGNTGLGVFFQRDY